ncbi:hypothetical protein BDW22DRAFT_1356301 [Trametopsis cervina]|nr:hypothetical protein BDW22DRAFT_1356301 [Trametopsis cervina]
MDAEPAEVNLTVPEIPLGQDFIDSLHLGPPLVHNEKRPITTLLKAPCLTLRRQSRSWIFAPQSFAMRSPILKS